MSFIKNHWKKLLLLIILVALVWWSANHLINRKYTARDIGYIDLGPHPSDVMIRFEREYNGLKYQDALNFTQQEYDALTKEQIIKMQDERFNNWVRIIERPNEK